MAINDSILKDLDSLVNNKKIILYPLSILYANTFATLKILYELKNKGTTMKLKNNLVRFDQFNDIVELSKYNKLEKKYSK